MTLVVKHCTVFYLIWYLDSPYPGEWRRHIGAIPGTSFHAKRSGITQYKYFFLEFAFRNSNILYHALCYKLVKLGCMELINPLIPQIHMTSLGGLIDNKKNIRDPKGEINSAVRHIEHNIITFLHNRIWLQLEMNGVCFSWKKQ